MTAPPGRRRWAIAFLLGIGVVINYLDRVNLSVAQVPLHREFGVTNETFGILSSAFNWTYCVLQIPMGALLDRFGVHLLLSIGAFLWSIASFGSAFSPGLRSFFGSRLLLGVGEAPTFPGNAKAIGYWFPREERSLPTSLFDGAAKLGPAIGVLIVGFMTLRYGWRFSFAFTGVLSFLYFVAFYFFYRDPRPNESQGDAVEMESAGASIWYLLKQPKVDGLFLGMAAYNYVFYLLLYWLPSYFHSLIDERHAIVYTSIVWIIAAAADVLIGGLLVDVLVKAGHGETLVRQSVLIGGMLLGMCIIGAQHTRNPVTAMIWIAIAIGGLSAAAPVGWSLPSLIGPRNSVGRIGGIMNFGNQIAGIAAPIITGWVAGRNNHFGPAFLVAGLVLAGGICGYIFLLGRIEPIPEPEFGHDRQITR